ncbi:TPA: hypothetical protein SOL41_003507 [Clostridioides difficile]|nr:hypothetical protein [Clostridioides difficile]HEK4624414.1 hypothetical protein [Clostridioides difficile]HEK4859187.1 hypothetical protein [Clostridioides difficile]
MMLKYITKHKNTEDLRMKKVLLLITVCLLSVGLVACSSTNNKDAENTTKKEKKANENEVDGIKITIKNVTKEDIKGDINEDGSFNENGEYFSDGIEKKKAADYVYEVVNVEVENKTDKAVKLFQTGWNAVGTDGYEFKDIKVTDKLDNQQVPANYKFDAQVKILVEKNMNVKEIVLKYNLKDYSRLFEAMEYANQGASKSDVEKKFPELYKDNWIELGEIKVEQ